MSKSADISGSGRRKSMLSRSPFSSLTILEHQSRLGPSELSELSERSDPSEQSQSLQSESDEVLTSVKPGFKTHRSSKSQPSITVESNLPERQATRMRSNSYLDRLRPLSAMSFPSRFPTRNNSLESPNSSGRSTPTSVFDFNPGKVLDYGEVQTSNAGWRRTSEFFVLTESYILRYRNEKKAAADFSMLVPTSSHMRHRRGSQSASSLQGMLQSSSTDSPSELSGEKLNRIPLVDIISVQVMKDGDSRVTIEVTWLPQAALHASNLAIQLDRENGKPHFLENLSDLARQNIIRQDAFLSQAHLRVVHDALEASKESVSEIDSYNIHKVVRRRANLAKGSAQLSLDDLATKDPPVVAFLVLSNHKIHFIPLSKNSRKACGVVTLRHAIVSSRDDSFDLIFRTPQEPTVVFELASVHSHDVAQQLHEALETYLPNWPMRGLFTVPKSLENKLSDMETPYCPPTETFSRILEAHCAAFGIDRSRLQYVIHMDVEDAPCIQLLKPSKRSPSEQLENERSKPEDVRYTVPELVAVMRALRHSDYFASASFANIDLDCIRTCLDYHAPEHIRDVSVLIQELRAIVKHCGRLRRLDFTKSILTPELRRVGKDKGCGILDALRPVCIQQDTNVDWIILNGIPLSNTDVKDLMSMMADRACHLRAVELSGCQLDKWHLEDIMSVLPTQQNTLEAIHLSNNPGCLGPGLFGSGFTNCRAMRIVNLSNIRISYEAESFIPANVLQSWRLEELYLSQTRFNDATLSTIISYAHSDASRALRVLHLDDTQISAEGIAELFKALGNRADQGRKLHLDVSGNSLSPLHPIAEALRNNLGPTSLTMRLAEFREQHDYQNLAEALISNTSLRYLDMAESIFDFVPDEETSMALKEILANNKTLEHLDISGECARLEASNMGPSINQALCGLFKNSTLKVLVIRNQKIDGEGAAVLAQVLKDNMTLREIHLERNVISLRGFFLLVQALHHNKTLTFLSDAEDMKGTALKRINSYARKAMPLAELNRQASIAGVRSRFFKSTTKKESTKEPVHTATSASMKFASRWKREQMQLRLYLERNKKIATSEDDPTNAAEPSPDDDDDSDLEYPTDNDPTPPPPNMDFENAVEALGPDLARDYAWIWAHMREHTYEVFR